jgi:hypothetical protein
MGTGQKYLSIAIPQIFSKKTHNLLKTPLNPDFYLSKTGI